MPFVILILGPLFTLFYFIFPFLLYILPSLMMWGLYKQGERCRASHWLYVFMPNILLGWTIIGWFFALGAFFYFLYHSMDAPVQARKDKRRYGLTHEELVDLHNRIKDRPTNHPDGRELLWPQLTEANRLVVETGCTVDDALAEACSPEVPPHVMRDWLLWLCLCNDERGRAQLGLDAILPKPT